MKNNNAYRKMAKRVAEAGILIALAFILSYIEALLPFSFIYPGIKIGFANIVILSCIYIFPSKEVFMVSVIRILLVSVTFGNISMLLYSFSGALLSFLTMLTLKKLSFLSPITVSGCGGLAHSLGQIIAAVLMLGKGLLYYLPILMMSGLICGLLIGVVSVKLINYLKHHKAFLT